MSYAIPTNELTLTDIKAYKAAAVEAGVKRGILKLGISRGEEVVREAQTGIDFPGAYVPGVENYITGVLAAGWNFVGSLGAAAVLPVGMVAVFYKIADWSGIPNITAVRFRVGGTGASTKGTFNIQVPINTKVESEVYLSEPIVYDPQDVLFIQCYAIAAGPAENLGFGCFIIEKVGANVS